MLCSICPLSWHEYSGSLITSAGHQHLMPLITLSVGLLLSHQVWVPVKELLISPFLGPWLWPFSGKVLCNQPKVPGWFAMFDTFNQIPPMFLSGIAQGHLSPPKPRSSRQQDLFLRTTCSHDLSPALWEDGSEARAWMDFRDRQTHHCYRAGARGQMCSPEGQGEWNGFLDSSAPESPPSSPSPHLAPSSQQPLWNC